MIRTSKKIAGSNTDKVTAFFISTLPNSSTTAMGSIQSLTGENKVGPARKSDNFTAIFVLIVWKIYDPQRLTTL
jgi:hypothetical protein